MAKKTTKKEFLLSEDQQTLLIESEKLHLAGKSKSYSVKEVKKYLLSKLGK